MFQKSSSLTRMPTHFIVGREEEMNTFRLLLSTAQAQTKSDVREYVPHGIFFTGVAGIGKTRLAQAAEEEAERLGWSVLFVNRYEQEKKFACYLWKDVLQKAFDQDIWQPQEMNAQHRLSPLLVDLLPSLADILKQATAPFSADPAYASLHLWESIQTIITTISATNPILIIVDDIHWIDEESCNILSHLLRNIHGFPIVILGMSCLREQRENITLSSLITELRKEELLEVRTLAPLAHEHIRAIATSASSSLSEQEIEDIQAHALGNPLLAEGLAHTFSRLFPPSITSFCDRTFRHVSEPCHGFLLSVAVLGPSFTFTMARDICLRGLAMDEDRCIDLLEEAQRSGILTEEGHGNTIVYSFHYPLLVKYLASVVSAARWTVLQSRAYNLLH